MQTVLSAYNLIVLYLQDHVQRDERGDVVGFIGIAILVVAVVVGAIPQTRQLVTDALAKLREQLLA